MNKRRKEAIALMARAFGVALAVFGDEEGRRLWRDVPKRRRGREKGSTRPQQDRNLLKLYDKLLSLGENRRRLPGEIGKVLSGVSWPKVGTTTMTTSDALTRRLRRLLKQREEEVRARAIGNPLLWWDK
jgi:hypothetical protein